jgi:hypothetical protein
VRKIEQKNLFALVLEEMDTIIHRKTALGFGR